MSKTSKRWTAVAALLLVTASAAAASLPDFTGIVEKNGPAVVNVQAVITQPEGAMPAGAQGMPPDFFRFFGIPMPRQQPGAGEEMSLGSGFIISSDGYILTNNHVVAHASKVTVKLSDRRDYTAKVVGADPSYDIALLKIDAKNLPTVSIGDSNTLKAGQWVLAIGSPYGLSHTVTAGIVSAVGRSLGNSDQPYVPFIQTDVPINRGNSGGPLFNLDGQVVGINSQIFSNSGGYMGLSFAIPIDVAMNAVQQLKAKGYVSRGMIGVFVQPLTQSLAKSMKLGSESGALVAKLVPGGAAETAGVHVRDLITAFNGQPVYDASDLPPMVGMAPIGSTARLSVLRDGKPLTLDVKIEAAPRNAADLAAVQGRAESGNNLGLEVENITPQQRSQLGLKNGEGVLITRVLGQAAMQAGLQPGDVILMVGQRSVGSAKAFDQALQGYKPGDEVMLLVRRDNVTQFIAIPVPKPG
ncbi:MAG TPA: DegQ family serine endoprotease [Rhodanobacteraceae bacterium]|nr:DegQ family serine endoprotease [Rhodanobacteraceae bacterium]